MEKISKEDISRIVAESLESRKRDKMLKMSDMQKLQKSKAELLSRVSIPDLVDESKFVWTPSAVIAPRQYWTYGQNIEILIPAGQYIANVAKTKMIFRPIIKYDQTQTNADKRMLCLNSAKSCFQLTSITHDSVEAVDQQGERSRPICNAILHRFKESSANGDSASQGEYDRLRYKQPLLVAKSTVGLGSSAQLAVFRNSLSVNEPMFFTSGEPISANGAGTIFTLSNVGVNQESEQAYYYQAQEQSDWRRRFYTQSCAIGINNATNTEVQTITPLQNVSVTNSNTGLGNNEIATFIELELGDLCMELASLQNVPMNTYSFGIKIQFRLVEPNYCLSVYPRVDCDNTDTNMLFYASDTYQITDVSVKLRRHDIMYDKLNIVKEIALSSVYPFLTYSYKRWPITAQNQVQFTFSVNANNMLGYFWCMTPTKGLTASQAIVATGIQYYNDSGATPANVVGACWNHYDQDHLYVQTNRSYVDIDGVQYSSNQLNIPSRQYATYCEMLSESSLLFAGREYSVPLVEFLANRAVYFTAVNNQGARGVNVKGKSLGFFIEFNDTIRSSSLSGNYDIHIFFLCVKNLLYDATKGIIIE